MARSKTGPAKVDLVREALDLGIKKPIAISDHIKNQGVEITPAQVSNYKNYIKKHKRKLRRMGAAPERGKPGPKPKSAFAGNAGFAAAVATIKELCHRLGKEEVKKVVELF